VIKPFVGLPVHQIFSLVWSSESERQIENMTAAALAEVIGI